MKKTADYRTAVRWIAHEDNPGDDESAEDLSAYLTVALVADLFGKTADVVAADVYALRHPAPARRHYCTRCEEELVEWVWLELDTNTGLYHRPEDFPEDGESQGAFTFGTTCARRELAATAAEVA